MAFVDRSFPQSGRAIGITDDDRRRPLRDLLITHHLQDSDIDGKHLSISWSRQAHRWSPELIALGMAFPH